MSEADSPFDITVAHQARMYNYLLGGKDHFAADRAASEEMTGARNPARTARTNRPCGPPWAGSAEAAALPSLKSRALFRRTPRPVSRLSPAAAARCCSPWVERDYSSTMDSAPDGHRLTASRARAAACSPG
jgi:hypothetical protein